MAVRRHHGIDIGVVPHIEHTGGAGSCGDCKNCKAPEEWIEMAWCNTNPTSAVNTASNMTRGFISAMKSGKRVVRRDCAGN